jgi:hypothetical protein
MLLMRPGSGAGRRGSDDGRPRAHRLAAVDVDDRITEVDVNPLMVRDAGQGIVAVDALVVLRPEHEVMA